MDNRWSDDDARRAVADMAAAGADEELALQVYATRLLGAEPSLVRHGGGNSSVKTVIRDLSGEEIEVICVKGSGWDMARIEPRGMPAVRLAPLRRLEALERLSDAEMVNQQRRNLIDASAPNPSVELLLHAFLPHKFVDHSHANAVLALSDQPEGEAICGELYGARAALVPYVMSGLALAKTAAAAQAAHPDCEGLILLKHGIFTFGDSARQAYERMIELVTLAEERLGRPKGKARKVFTAAALPGKPARAVEVAPILRGLLAVAGDPAEGLFQRFVLAFRESDAIRHYVDGAELTRYSQQGPVTPDHAIRTKPLPLVLPPANSGKLAEFAKEAARAIGRYETRYRDYFARNSAERGVELIALDPRPRVALVPGLGLFAAGESAAAAAIAADLAETTIEVVTEAEAIGRFESISEAQAFDIEYWSLEQAKLGRGAEKPLARQIMAVTGGAGAIGAATAAAFKAAGAEVALLDRPGDHLSEAAARLGALPVACDVTDNKAVTAAFEEIVAAFGGLDKVLRESFELNFFAHQRVAKTAVAIMEKQGTGGVLLFNASKQAVNPGPNFGPYGLPKAATLALMRQYAIDYGAQGIRANAVNADRIKSGLLTEDMVADRAKARGVSEEDYMRGNLLGREVRAEDVGQAFLNLALAAKTTGAILTVDGGNIAAALR
jgi:rhamnose utilization protein RhaD (predicted bifunctional aldolase and dehydrogenase)/NAD(P)-dependent dehydrogenase (short-subunit alcohol dehydrogenase family)